MVREVLTLRALARLAQHEHLTRRRGIEPQLERLLGMAEKRLDKISKARLSQLISAKLARRPRLGRHEILGAFDQLRHVGDKLGLSTLERALLLVLVWMRSDPLWRYVVSILDEQERDKPDTLLACVLRTKVSLIKAALRPNGRLLQSGLLTMKSAGAISISDRFSVLEGLDEFALQSPAAWELLMQSLFSSESRHVLAIQDFVHLGHNLDIAVRLVKGALRDGIRGLHILLYGPPGTGKTALAWALARHAATTVRGVNMADSEGDCRAGMSRLGSLVLGQKMLAGSDSTVFVFDELEDVFPNHIGIYFQPSSAFFKGWINEVLEQTCVPTIWTANSLRYMDKAHLRRFSLIMEVPGPTRSVRRRLLDESLQRHKVGAEWLNRTSQNETITPADIAELKRVATATGVRGTDAELLLDNVLRERSHALSRKAPSKARNPAVLKYDTAHLNLDGDAGAVLAGLGNLRQGNILFYGPPGTGKTALASYMAEQLDVPLLSKRGSDLISMWVGETEKNIADAFRAASQERAVLLIDEADSFFREREHAHYSWEVTQVNEILVQMENFDGIFIASTNLIDDLDQAAFRRFDVKLRFDYLTASQRLALFDSVVPATDATRVYRDAVRQIDRLTPGDFRAALRRLEVMGRAPTAQVLCEALREEVRHKDRYRTAPIGFTTT